MESRKPLKKTGRYRKSIRVGLLNKINKMSTKKIVVEITKSFSPKVAVGERITMEVPNTTQSITGSDLLKALNQQGYSLPPTSIGSECYKILK
jgi:hypothetical protein